MMLITKWVLLMNDFDPAVVILTDCPRTPRGIRWRVPNPRSMGWRIRIVLHKVAQLAILWSALPRRLGQRHFVVREHIVPEYPPRSNLKWETLFRRRAAIHLLQIIVPWGLLELRRVCKHRPCLALRQSTRGMFVPWAWSVFVHRGMLMPWAWSVLVHRTTAYRPASRAISAKLAIPRTFPAVATLA